MTIIEGSYLIWGKFKGRIGMSIKEATMKLNGKKVASITTSLCFMALAYGIPLAWGQSAHTSKLIEGAKREGNLVWYTTMNISDSKRLLDSFEKKYPFVKTHLSRSGGDRTVNKIMSETRAGRWQFDVVSASQIKVLAQRKLLSTYDSPEADAFIRKFKSPAGQWTAIYTNYFVIGYNTNMVSEAEAPRRWEDLLDPKWKGKISIDQEEYPWYASLVDAWGKEKTKKYMSALAKQNIQWRNGHTLIAQLMSAGEFPVAIVYAHRVEDMKKKGAPIDWVNTLDPIIVNVYGLGVAAKPNNPNTAKLFIDFALSKKGQAMIRSFNRIPARSDISPLSPKLDRAKLKLRVVPKELSTRYKEYIQEFRSVFGL